MQKLTGQYENKDSRIQMNTGNDGRLAAFFDVDGTLIRGDCQALEARYLLSKKQMPPEYIRPLLMTLIAVQLNRIGWLSLCRQNEIYLKTYLGQTRQNLDRLSQGLFDQVICRQFFSGTLDGICAQTKKQEIVLALAREHDLNLAASHVYSDHHSDIPFLSAVGCPGVVNPTKKMVGYARDKGWPIHSF